MIPPGRISLAISIRSCAAESPPWLPSSLLVLPAAIFYLAGILEKESSSVKATTPPDQRDPVEAAGLRWTIHPLAEEPPIKSILLATLIVGLPIGAVYSFEGLVHGVISLIVLAASLSRYFLPTRITLDHEGIHTCHLGWRRKRFWKEFRRADIHEDGVFLSPFSRSSRMDPFRGYFLTFGNNRNQVTCFVEKYVAQGSP